MKSGYEILNDPFLNKGTAFTKWRKKKIWIIGTIANTIPNDRNSSETSLQTISSER